MSNTDTNVLPFPSLGQPATGKERSVEIHERIRCIAGALNRSQRHLHEIEQLLLEIETEDKKSEGAGWVPERCSDLPLARAETGFHFLQGGNARPRILIMTKRRGCS
jgi:hypothetical protein